MDANGQRHSFPAGICFGLIKGFKLSLCFCFAEILIRSRTVCVERNIIFIIITFIMCRNMSNMFNLT